MEVRVDAVAVGGQSIPQDKDVFLALRVGDVQKQTRLSSSRAYRFPEPKCQDGKLYGRVEILKRVGHASISLDLGGDAQDVVVSCSDLEMPQLAFKVEAVVSQASEEQAKATRVERKLERKNSAARYIVEHNLEELLATSLREVVRQRPANPREYISGQILRSSSTPALAPLPPVATRPEAPAEPCPILPEVPAAELQRPRSALKRPGSAASGSRVRLEPLPLQGAQAPQQSAEAETPQAQGPVDSPSSLPGFSMQDIDDSMLKQHTDHFKEERGNATEVAELLDLKARGKAALAAALPQEEPDTPPADQAPTEEAAPAAAVFEAVAAPVPAEEAAAAPTEEAAPAAAAVEAVAAPAPAEEAAAAPLEEAAPAAAAVEDVATRCEEAAPAPAEEAACACSGAPALPASEEAAPTGAAEPSAAAEAATELAAPAATDEAAPAKPAQAGPELEVELPEGQSAEVLSWTLEEALKSGLVTWATSAE